MNAATITQAQDKGLRHQFADLLAAIGAFSEQLFAAHGGWFVARQTRIKRASAVAIERQRRAELFSLASSVDAHSPNLAAELRYLANR